jgi:hypothetical protein
MFSRYAGWWQARVLIVAALAIAALLVPTGRMAINMVRPAGGVSTQSDTSTTTQVSTPATSAPATTTQSTTQTQTEDQSAGSKSSVKSTVTTLFSDNFTSVGVGSLMPVVSSVPVVGTATGTATGTLGTVTSVVGSVTMTLDGVTGMPLASTVTGTGVGAAGSVTGTVDGLLGTVDGLTGTVTGTSSGAVGTVTGTASGVASTATGIAGGTLGWRAEDGIVPRIVLDGPSHVVSHVDSAWSHLAVGGLSAADMTITSQVKALTAGVGSAGIAGRFQDPSNMVFCGLANGNHLELVKMVAGHLSVLGTASKAVTTGVFHTIQMVFKGNSVGCSVDGTSVLHGTDGLLKTGSMALIAGGALPSEFGSVRVTS